MPLLYLYGRQAAFATSVINRDTQLAQPLKQMCGCVCEQKEIKTERGRMFLNETLQVIFVHDEKLHSLLPGPKCLRH